MCIISINEIIFLTLHGNIFILVPFCSGKYRFSAANTLPNKKFTNCLIYHSRGIAEQIVEALLRKKFTN